MSAKKSARTPPNEKPPNGDPTIASAGGSVNGAPDSKFQEKNANNVRDPASAIDGEQVPTPVSVDVQELSISPFRREVVTLATQLVTAQIAASAQLAASNGLASAIKRIAAEFLMGSARIKSDLETLRKNPDLIDSAFVDRAYAHLLGAADVKIPMPDLLEPLDNAVLNRLFDGALARAQQLLRSPLEDATIIHAEQIFTPTERIVESAIGKRFVEAKWPLLENWDTCYKLMVRIERWFSDHLNELHVDDGIWRDDNQRLLWFLNFAREKPESDLSRKIFDLVASHGSFPMDTNRGSPSLESLMEDVWKESFVWVVFGNRIPKPRSRKDPKITRYYRAWGLFRYLRLFGDCNEEGRDILTSLSVKRKELSTDLSPYAIDPKTDLYHSFGPLDLLTKRREAQVTRYRAKQ